MSIDSLIKDVLAEMGVDESQPPHWMPHKHKVKDQTTGEVIHEVDDGYICSYCGKKSYWKAPVCEGCNSYMVVMDGEWWSNEDGGYYCSNCGNYYDDYFEDLPSNCSKCNSVMSVNYDMEVDRNYRLSKKGRWVELKDYPNWLRKMKKRRCRWGITSTKGIR